MIRIVIENILLFLLPTALYAIFIAATRTNNKQGVLDGAPLAWLLMAGTILVVATLAFYGSSSGGKPGQAYDPASMQNGQIAPGRIHD